MIDLYLRFDSHESMLNVIRPLNMIYIDDQGNEHVSAGGHDYAAWEVGEIPGRTGYHVNMRVIDPNFDYSALVPYQVHPKDPSYRWA